MTSTALPIHPSTGLTAAGLRRDGRPIWPIAGAADPDPANPPADPPANPPPADPAKPPKEPATGTDGDKPLGPAGEKALADERTKRREAERELARYRKAEQDKADADKSEAEKRAAADQRADAAEAKALRIEVAFAKGLSPTQAKRLAGATREELEADADEILRDFPTQPAPKPAPKPDPSQGARGTLPARPRSLGEAVGKALRPTS